MDGAVARLVLVFVLVALVRRPLVLTLAAVAATIYASTGQRIRKVPLRFS